MKLRPRTFEIFWDVHAWVGVIAALLLYVIFLMGAFALFYEELNIWSDPTPGAAVSTAHAPPAQRPILNPLLAQLVREQHARGKSRVGFIIDHGGLRAQLNDGDRARLFLFAQSSGRLEPVPSDLGSFLFALHYLGPIPKGMYLAGVAAMALLLTLLTGLLIHLKDLVRHWFQFRPQRAPRTWVGDLHKVLGVFGLPYQLLFAWSGAVLCLSWVTVEPAFRAAVFRGDAQAAAAARGESAEVTPSPAGLTNAPLPLPDLDDLVVRARQAVPDLEPRWVGLQPVGDPASTVSVYGDVAGLPFGNANVTLRASDGQVLSRSDPRHASAYQRFESWFFGLHFAHFGGYGIKLLYVLLALASCAVLITGNLIWLERRERTRALLGNRALKKLTISFGAGLPVATAALLVANRLLPLRLADRPAVEQWIFAGVWLAAAVTPFFRRDARHLTATLLWLAAALFAGAAILDVATEPARLGDPLHRAFDVAFLGLACGCAAGARRIGQRS